MIISRTPYRISFFGGGSDYPGWYLKHGGEVLATTINKYCYITCRYLPPFFEHKYRVVYSYIETCSTIDEIQHPAVRQILKYLKMKRGVEIHHDGDLPARSGMGSSSSFAVGLLHALYALQGQMSSKWDLAKQSIYIEQNLMEETVGSQDQVLAAMGGLNHVTFSQDGEISSTPLTLSKDRIDELDDHLMLCYTGILRTASNIAGTYVPDIEAKERQVRSLMEMVGEGISILNSGQNLLPFGQLLDEAWKAKSAMSTAISNKEVDEIYAAAKSAGAVGGKLLGAGGGGFMVLFVPPAKQPMVKERLSKLIHVPFRFERAGSQIILFDHDEDYSNAEIARASQPVQAFRELVHTEEPD